MTRKFKHKKSGWEAIQCESYYKISSHSNDYKMSFPASMIEETQDWEEVRQPLFVTENGEDRFDGDKYFYIDLRGLIAEGIAQHRICYDKCTKRFSTKEAAEKYIYEQERRKIVHEILVTSNHTFIIPDEKVTSVMYRLYDLIKTKATN